MRLKIWIALALFAVSGSASAESEPSNGKVPERTREDTNREVIRTYAQFYMEQQDYLRTENLLIDYLRTEDQDGNLWMMLGDAQLNTGHLAQACLAFKKADERFQKAEDRNYALYRLADCLYRGNHPAEALALLKGLSRKKGVSDTATLAIEAMRHGAPLPEYSVTTRGKLRVSGALNTGFDSNVLLIEESVAGSVPVSTRGSYFVNPVAQVGYLTRLSGEVLESRYLVSFTDYISETSKIYNSLYNRLDVLWGSGDTRYGAFGNLSFINRDPFQVYNWDTGVSYNHHYLINTLSSWDLEIPVRYQNYPIDSSHTEDNIRKGVGLTVRGRYRWIESEKKSFLASAALDNQYTTGKNYRWTSLTIPVAYLTTVPLISDLGLVNSFSGDISGSYYYQSDLNRKDMGLRLGAGLLKRFANRWNASVDYSYFHNFSTVEAARYTKEVVSLLVSHDFL